MEDLSPESIDEIKANTRASLSGCGYCRETDQSGKGDQAVREKTLRIIVSFHTTTDVLAVEAYCSEHEIPGRLIPLPAIISAGCGMCWSAPAEARQSVTEAVKNAGVSDAGIYQMLL